MHKLAQRTYVNADSSAIAEEGSADAAYLLGNAGDEVSDETAARLGLITPDENAPTVDAKKDELVTYAESRGIDSSGTKAEIAARIEASDQAAREASGTAQIESPAATSTPDVATSTVEGGPTE